MIPTMLGPTLTILHWYSISLIDYDYLIVIGIITALIGECARKNPPNTLVESLTFTFFLDFFIIL